MQLRFSQSLYLREAVLRAREAYTAHFRAEVTEDGADLIVCVETDDPRDGLFDSFANHVLFETVRLRQRTAETK